MLTVIYDQECWHCRQLAEMIYKRQDPKLRVESQGEFEKKHRHLSFNRNSIGVWDGVQLYQDTLAWEMILKHHPWLKQLNWIAQKLGIASQTARTMEIGSHWFRRFCPQCGRRR